jgi:hypothetical protein
VRIYSFYRDAVYYERKRFILGVNWYKNACILIFSPKTTIAIIIISSGGVSFSDHILLIGSVGAAKSVTTRALVFS